LNHSRSIASVPSTQALPVANETTTEAPAAAPVEEVAPPPPEPVFITPDQILHALSDALSLQFNLEGELTLMPNTSLTKVKVPTADWYVQMVAPLPSTLTSRLHLRYRLTDGFNHQPEQTLAVRAEWWREAYMSNRLLRPRDLDAKDAYYVERVNWLQYRGALVSVDNDLSLLRLKTTWRANEPLRWTAVETRPLIEEGEVVEVIASEGAMRITMRGVALENGRAGELISVRNLQSRKEIQGIVSHENTVLVIF
jgi:flagella basal body P-ring formation protein FlgA